MLKPLLSAVRRATLVGIGALALVLGASFLTAPAASAYVPAFVPVISPAESAGATTAPDVHDSNLNFLENEQVVDWTNYRVTGDHEITFSVQTGNSGCYDVRAEAAESNGTLQVATVEGTLPSAPDRCTMEARTVQVRVYTNAPASSLNVQQLPESQVLLNN